jgi:23S rRNA (guanine745-N1)-methyltransferase
VDGRVACARRHSFDVARRGYVNLLQPQERKSPRPGDQAEILAARRRFLALLTPGPGDAVLEVGCGGGHHLAAIAARFGCEGYGLDISVTAIDAAARRHPSLHWVVANGDRDLPYADASFRIVASVTARRNAAEFRRGQRARLAALADLDVTLSRDALLFRPAAARRRVEA